MSEAVKALEKSLRARAVKRDRHMTLATEGVASNLASLVAALVGQHPSAESQHEFHGALRAVERINLLAWRYFVEQSPYEGQEVMQEVQRARLWRWFVLSAVTRGGLAAGIHGTECAEERGEAVVYGAESFCVHRTTGFDMIVL